MNKGLCTVAPALATLAALPLSAHISHPSPGKGYWNIEYSFTLDLLQCLSSGLLKSVARRSWELETSSLKIIKSFSEISQDHNYFFLCKKISKKILSFSHRSRRTIKTHFLLLIPKEPCKSLLVSN